jgi:NitT/TauT family transport system ATP-binding protein
MAFQNPNLLPWRTTLDNVLLPLEIVERYAKRYRKERELFVAKAYELLETVGLRQFAQRYPWELSGGMQQRASLCRALIHDPELLLLDEPFAALDAFTREELWAVLQDLWLKKRPTVVHVTHDLAESVFLADTVHVVTKGPGRISSSHMIDLPRPRSPFGNDSVAMVQMLRQRIADVRAA